MPSNPGFTTGRTPQKVGYTRPGHPRMMGWADVVRYSERTDTAVRQMRMEHPREFPLPIAVLTATPVYLAEEVEAFFDKYPRRRLIDDDLIRQIQSMVDDGMAQARVAEALHLRPNTISKYARAPRI